MSRLDLFTAVIIIVCIGALVFLLYKTTDLFKGKQDKQEIVTDTGEVGENDVIDPADYEEYYDAGGEAASDTSAEGGSTIVIDESAAGGGEDIDYATDTEKASEPQTPPPSSSFTNDKSASSSEGDYLVLAGSFEFRHNADSYVQTLHKLGYSNAEVTLFNRGKYATVLVDRFYAADGAMDLLARLKKDGVNAYVHKKRAGEQ